MKSLPPVGRITAVLPIKNKKETLAPCLASIAAACVADGNVRVVLVDNGSTDGALVLQQQYADRFHLISSTANRVGAVRNEGARDDPDAAVYAFIDSDCVVPPDFFVAVRETFAISNAAAVGCEVVSRSDGHWTERTWDALHRPRGDGPRHYINSACFCVRSEWFWRICGFDEEKVSSEDVDICRRLAARGGTMWQSERLQVVHLGNPQSISGLFARIRWHGAGIWEPGKGLQWSRITMATFAHAAFVILGVISFAVFARSAPLVGGALLILSVLVAPVTFTLARMLQFRRLIPIIPSTALMVITFFARLRGLLDSLGAAHRGGSTV